MSLMLAKLFGTNNARQLKRLKPIVDQINSLEPSMQALSDEQLGEKTNEFRQQLSQGRSLDDILPQAFAVVREAALRTLGQRHYDVQLIGGIVLHQGKIAEMKTGEGKTLTATLALYLNALDGKGAHLVTVNDYLARRDAAWMQPIYEMLGLSVGIIQNALPDAERKKVYNCDIVYATNNELGFDYLRDNMKFRLSDYVQRDLNFAIVDEVDSILIDEARTPLIISGGAEDVSDWYSHVDRVIPRLVKDQDYEVEEKHRTVQLTESGVDTLESALNIKNLYALEHMNVLHHVMQALKAHAIFKRDVDYVVVDGQVLIVDEFTGRILSGRRYSDGLHQALEAKEGVEIEKENHTLASITLQNYFRLYKTLAGMTGTAETESEEFHKIYGLDVVAIPTNKPMIRHDKPDLIFLTQRAKFKAIVDDVKDRHAHGQPVLIGTVAVEMSELLSQELKRCGIAHEVLNAKQHEREAEIVEHAGKPGRVTIATNMAGRGTDIKLKEDALEAGGLYILGTERHESRRIDNQLRGRSGRQGDAGESRFYLSLEDDLIRRFAGESLKKNMERFGMTEDEEIESRMVSRSIEQAQEKVEKHNFDVRKHLIDYDDVLNQHRTVMYQYRREILEGGDHVAGLVRDMIIGCVQELFAQHCPTREAVSEETLSLLCKAIETLAAVQLSSEERKALGTGNSDQLKKDMIDWMLTKYHLYRDAQTDQTQMQLAEQWLLLETIDQAWKQHMINIDHLKEGIGLRGWGQKNPLYEYKKEAFAMFEDMMRQIRFESVHNIFHLNLERFSAQELERKRERELGQITMNSSAPEAQHLAREGDKVGRNDDCPCGSGKKYKKCCLKN